jgi:hypothetical protein
MHLNKIIARLEMSGPFGDLHRKNKDNFIMSVMQAIGSFLIDDERL